MNSVADWRSEVARWPPGDREEWDERAAIRQFCGEQTPLMAEWGAYLDTKRRRATRGSR